MVYKHTQHACVLCAAYHAALPSGSLDQPVPHGLCGLAGHKPLLEPLTHETYTRDKVQMARQHFKYQAPLLAYHTKFLRLWIDFLSK